MGMGEFKIFFDEGAPLGRWTVLAGAAWVVGGGACCILSLKIAAKSVRAAMVSSPTLANGTSGWRFCKPTDVSLTAMSNRSVDDNSGI
jgi:hypothetical protein